MDSDKQFHTRLLQLSDGSYNVLYNEKRYLLSKQTLLENRLIKLYAEELGANDFISLNYYVGKHLLKPCEMPQKKVIHFVENLELID